MSHLIWRRCRPALSAATASRADSWCEATVQKTAILKRFLFGMAMCGCTVWSAAAQTVETAAAPPPMPIDGVITDELGQPAEGLVSVIFALYEAQVGGVPLWVEIQVVHVNAEGRYVALLGSTTELNVTLFASGNARWLGIQPEGQPEQPRVRLLSVPYALKAVDADTVGGQPISAFVLSKTLNTSLAATNLSDAVSKLTSSSLVPAPRLQDNVLTVDGTARVTSQPPAYPTSGTSLEMYYAADSFNGTPSAYLISFDRTNSLYKPFNVDASTVTLRNSGRAVVTVTGQNVGLGVTDPTVRLSVLGTARLMSQEPDFPTSGTSLEMYYAADSFNGTPSAYLISFDRTNSLYKPFNVDASTVTLRNSGLAALTVSGGKVGIGTASPTSMLHVAGNVAVDGNIAAKYQDVAEWVEAVGAPPPGTVVVADPAGQNRVKTANAPYDTGVLGAVSAQPGVILGEPGPTKVLVAQSGRVTVKVDASYGAITSGDLLSTSPTPGYAMRSEPLTLGKLSWHRPGTVLGKALEALPAGRGEILVLITLQ